MDTTQLLSRQEAELSELEADPSVAFHRLALVDAVLSALATDGGPAVAEAKRRVDALRDRYIQWEDELTTLRRCAAALLCVDGLPPRFEHATLRSWTPPFVGAVDAPALGGAWQLWASVVLDGGSLEAAAAAVRRSTPQAAPQIRGWERELAEQIDGSRHFPDQAVLVMDWVTVVADQVGPHRLAVACAIGRYGALRVDDHPDDAVVRVPGVVARLLARCTLNGLRTANLGSGGSVEDLRALLRACKDPRVRALTCARIDAAVSDASRGCADRVTTRGGQQPPLV